MTALVWAVARVQLTLLRRSPDRLLPLATVPLFTTTFLAIAHHSGRQDLATTAVLGATLIGIWSAALYVAGDIIESDRADGILEGIVASPTPLPVVVLARIATVTVVSFAGLLESLAVAVVFFDQPVVIHHPVLFGVGLVCTGAAMAGTATVMSALFVLARSVRAFQNSFSYPFYLLSGAVVPVSLLPDQLEPLAKVVFLSWAADLLRASTRPEQPPDAGLQVAAVLTLGAIGFAVGVWSMRLILNRLRRAGSIGYA